MKALLTLLLPVMLLVTACEKNEYVVANRTVVVDVRPGSWIRSGNGTYYTTAIDLPELDNYLHDRGGILVYISFDEGRTYEQVPEVYEGVAYSYATSPGQIVLTVEGSNGTSQVSPPSFMTVKIVLIESDY